MPENINEPTAEPSKPINQVRGGTHRFGPGNPGRPIGSKNKRTVQKEALLALMADGDADLPSRVARIKEMYRRAPWEVWASFEKFLIEMDYGKPHLAIDVVHRMEAIDEAEQRMRENVWTGSGVTEGESQRDDGNRLN